MTLITPNTATESTGPRPVDDSARPQKSRPQEDGATASRRKLPDIPAAAVTLFMALFLVSIAALSAGVWLVDAQTGNGLGAAAFVAGAFFFIASFVIPMGVTREVRLEREESGHCDADYQDLEGALSGHGQKGRQETLKDLTLANFKQMRSFSVIAQRQARMSYYASLLGAGVSLLVLVGGAAVAVGQPSVAGKVSAGSLAVLGTALSAFLARTFIRTYDMGVRQMSFYYGQPLVHCYLLHAEWLALMAPDQFGQQAKLDMWQEVVQASIRASGRAQHHLLTLREHESWSPTAPRCPALRARAAVGILPTDGRTGHQGVPRCARG